MRTGRPNAARSDDVRSWVGGTASRTRRALTFARFARLTITLAVIAAAAAAWDLAQAIVAPAASAASVVLAVFVLALAISVVTMIALMTAAVSGPLKELLAAIRSFGAGDRSARMAVTRIDEVGVVGIAFNHVADRLQASEREIRQLNEDLERRVEERTAELAAATRELEAFSYSVSHDLRAPLRSIDGFSRALLDDHGAQLDQEGRRHLEIVRRSTEDMGRLIDDLLRLSRVARGEMRREHVDVSAMVSEIGAELARREPERRVELIVADGLETVGDRALLRAALVNLLSNAWKFTRERADARVEVGVLERPLPAFYVRDNGVGFDPAYADKLFAPFQRLHSQEQFEGTGIGLATVQRVIARHGGRIWAEARPGTGATFYFTIEPQAKAA